ncbi:glycosyltransferase family 39 protein [[Enterobacter] lignolyticus]|uniref:Glycosyltransferase RgtA/B/C/D-like domain-containing protein n=1 Tax=Enterobacter lignolyticus (strain SCF1) TaxID=701347 RepID=E3GA76_ENTLS|nr:glycosyltransferase family 39 protein [[Enterobacter] lignolyticus]ADO46523.1 hypothetical protein Entcl_0245 [[Enterobacter] lignolyticus SCF1]
MSSRFVAVWVLGYALLWTFATVLLDPTVPYDAVEALNWAQNADWGSPKNPWLVGMAMRPALWLPVSLSVYWYASHFLAIAVGMAGVWVLARTLSGSDRLAWLALLTLNLSGLINFDIISYNDNYLLVMLWPWMMLCFYLAITRHANWWLAFAAVAGLAAMAKYSTLAFVGFVFLSTLAVPRIRSCYRQPAFYAALLLGLLLILPNLIWLWQHDFAAFSWVDSQIKNRFNPELFSKAFTVFYPLLILWWILHRQGIRLVLPQSWALRVMLAVYLLPLMIIFAWFLFHQGGRLTEWLQPFFILTPALLVSCASRHPEQLSRGVCASLFGAAGLVLAGYIGVLWGNVANAGQDKSNIIPFSQLLDQQWQARYGTPLRYVGGEYWSQWLTFYAPSRPLTITPWDNDARPNVYNVHITQAQIQQQGALLVGRLGTACEQETFRAALTPWPDLRIDDVRQMMFQEDSVKPLRPLCIAFVKPAEA